jgi:hypothetical protein
MELIEIQNDSNLKNKFNDVGVPDFYSFVPTRYVEIRRFAIKIISMFSSMRYVISINASNFFH